MSKIKSIEVTIKVYYEDGTSVDRSTWCSGEGVKELTYSHRTHEGDPYAQNTIIIDWLEIEDVK